MRALLLLTVLAGCASVTVTEDDLRTIGRLPNQTLCYESVAAPERYKPAIHQELAKRREDCVSHWPAVQARLSAEQTARAIESQRQADTLRLLQPIQQQPYMIPPNQAPRQVQCTSRQVGPTVQTQCF